jgi:hypothetical protein
MNMSLVFSLVARKVLFGLVLVSIMIIALAHLFQDLHTYLGGWENSGFLRGLTFVLILSASAFGLGFLLRSRKGVEQAPDLDQSVATLFSLDFQSLGVKFLEGFVKGIESPPKDKESTS